MRYLHILTLTLFCLLIIAGGTAAAQNTVVVVPLGMAKQLGNIVTVAKQGGDYTDPVQALAGITDSGQDNPYVMIIGPGVYSLSRSLALKPYVSLIGFGPETTVLERRDPAGSSRASRSIIDLNGAKSAQITGLTLRLVEPDGAAAAVYADKKASLELGNVTIQVTARNSTADIKGVYWNCEGSLVLSRVDLEAEARSGDLFDISGASADARLEFVYTTGSVSVQQMGTDPLTGFRIGSHVEGLAADVGLFAIQGARGIYASGLTRPFAVQGGYIRIAEGGTSVAVASSGANFVMRDTFILAEGGASAQCTGFQIDSSSPVLENIHARLQCGNSNTVLRIGASSSPAISHVVALATGGGPSNIALDIADSSASPQVMHSSLQGDIAVDGITSGTRISETKLQGTVNDNDANTQCLDTYDQDLAAVNC